MNRTILTRVALRYQAIYLPTDRSAVPVDAVATPIVLAFVARLRDNGFCLSEEALRALSTISAGELADLTILINRVMQVDLNWAPLVKGWNVPTGETCLDHLVTFFANIWGREVALKGTTLPCGHLIPNGTFPLERYNGCPFCGKPFQTAPSNYRGQGCKLRMLRLFTPADMYNVFLSLLTSATPLDATQQDSLAQLLQVYDLPESINIPMKETAMHVVKSLVACHKDAQAGSLLATPADVLRYLWFEKTGYVQVIEPRTLIAHARRLYSHLWAPLSRDEDAAAKVKQQLRLHYNRTACLRVAKWLNQMPLTAYQAAENMHPKRGMWVRFIRALRLGEYSRKKGFEHLAQVLDMFYKQDYIPWQGRVECARQNCDATQLLALLQERPGLFARSLFATMLRFGPAPVLVAFNQVADKLPARLLLSLGNAAEAYFDAGRTRTARPITGVTHVIAPHRLLQLYSGDECKQMAAAVTQLYKQSMYRRFAAVAVSGSRTIYIHPMLYNIPVSVGNRSTTIQDTSCALLGTRFPVEGDAVRLFLQWGKGLPAQYLDMDLSCRVIYPCRQEVCYFGNLECTGVKHSGDIRYIPDQVGTAEYIELDLPCLHQAGAAYVVFTCNAYSEGALCPNLTVGWMNSELPMQISKKTGVAYDPSCVQHMVRIGESNLSKGLVFGVLNVAKREIIWLEMSFTAQTLAYANQEAIEALLRQLLDKLTIGELLDAKAEAQNLKRVDTPEFADEAYTMEWALNPAAVTQLLYL